MLCWLLLCWPQGISAQFDTNYGVRQFDTGAGLSNNWVSAIAQDSLGFLWVATQYGLNRYDGQEFRAYTYQAGAATGPGANWTRAILPAEKQQLWLGNYGEGLTLMQTDRGLFTGIKAARKGVITQLVRDAAGNLWYADRAGVCRVKSGNLSVDRFPLASVNSIIVTREAGILFTSERGLYRFRDGQLMAVPAYASEKLLAGTVTSQGDVLLLFSDRLELMPGGKEEAAIILATFPQPVYIQFFLYRFHELADGKIWVTLGKELLQVSADRQTTRRFTSADLLGDRFATVQLHCFYEDRENQLWVGTDHGIFQLRKQLPFRPSPPITGAPGIQGSRAILLTKTSMFLGGASGVFHRPRDGHQDFDQQFNYSVNALRLASDGWVYGVSDKHPAGAMLIRFNAESGQLDDAFSQLLPTNDGPAYGIVEDAAGRLWIANFTAVLVYNLVTAELFAPPVNAIVDGKRLGITAITLDKTDNLWLGNDLVGLIEVNQISKLQAGETPTGKNFRHLPEEARSMSSNIVLSLHATAEDEIWVGTDGGLNRLNRQEGTFTRFMRGAELVDDKVLAITSDQRGDIWFSTISHGIIHYQPTMGRFSNYQQRDGLFDNSMLIASIFQEESGKIWMGSSQGINAFNPADIKNKTVAQPPKLVCLEVEKFRDSLHLIEKLSKQAVVMHPRDLGITLRFAALSLSGSEDILYQFQLNGYHEKPLPPSTNGELTLTNLPKGNYTLAVKAWSARYGWAVAHPQISLKVIPPWYRSNLAYLCYLLLMAGLSIRFYRNQLQTRLAREDQQRMRLLTNEKLNWFHRIAHEFKTPLTVINGAVDRMSGETNPLVNEQSASIIGQTNHLKNQINDILSLASLRAAPRKLSLQAGDFIAYCQVFLKAFENLAETKSVELDFHSHDQELNIAFDEAIWHKILTNLLSNAIRHTPAGGSVVLRLKSRPLAANQRQLSITVSDTGSGITEALLPHIFTAFHKGSNRERGSGLGLTLVKELTELMGGTIKVKSKAGVGSRFDLELAVTEFSPVLSNVANDYLADESLPLILLAEDEAEITSYLRYCLETDYRVKEAADGTSAWKICRELVPDLVVTDLLMPGLNGFELTTKIKTDEATNHIPVLVLSGKSGPESRLKSAGKGADAFLSKPFQRRELLAVIRQLIENRLRLQQKYQAGEYDADPAGGQLDAFILKARELVLRHLEAEDYGVGELAKAVHLGRAQLFRKIKAITGHSPTIFIRNIKLNEARKLLRQTALTVAEVAYRNGFKDPAYFSRVYNETYGKSPSKDRK